MFYFDCKYERPEAKAAKSLYYFVVLYLLLISQASSKTYSNTCNELYFDVQKGTIIRTEDSIANGATVLRTMHATSSNACKMNCCKLHKCTVAVFETTTKNLCYLFNCGRGAKLCEFEQHARYTTSIRMNSIHSRDMSGLNVRGITHEELPAVQPVSKSAQRPTEPTRPDRQCRFPSDVQFRCLDAARFPSCVAVYDRCDGVPQCGDSSDELDCPAAVAATQRDKTDRAEDSNSGLPPSEGFSADGVIGSTVPVVMEIPATAAPAPAAASQSSSEAVAAASDLAESYRQARAAVVGLGVTLAVTLVAIVALGCRLRQLRARFARGGGGGGGGGISGKLRNQPVDEDYLINGMYL